MNVTVVLGIVVLLHLVSVVPWRVCSQRQRLIVKRTLVQKASATSAFCLDGSLPAYHLHRGFGAGQNNWLLQFEGGGWCNDLKSCLDRASTRRGSTHYMSKLEVFSGILSNDSSLNPGCSAGGLATFHHCDNFAEHLSSNANVKCLSDAGFFLDGRDINSKYTARNFFKGVVELQFTNILVPPSADIKGVWKECKKDPATCTPDEINILQGFRHDMLETLKPFLINSESGGMFINSCFAHCQSESQDTWFANDSPRVNDKTIAEAVGDWYFSRNKIKEIDCAYPCDKTCHNLIPKKPPQHHDTHSNPIP
ncbi:hypothetical protein RIF29_23666 [Crotalaria pallida]|uniref:Pectin acetylesterase n=1 Tax=Crotalaria pallida TaxID=3830 RepID=A0AAN9I8Q4_CROPI